MRPTCTVVLIGLAAACGGAAAAAGQGIQRHSRPTSTPRRRWRSARGFPGTPGTPPRRAGSIRWPAPGPTPWCCRRGGTTPPHGDSIEMTNIWPSSTPRATQRVLYLAHWDTRPHADGARFRRTRRRRCPAPTMAGRAWPSSSAWPMRCKAASRPTSASTCCSSTARTTARSAGRDVDVLIGATYYAAHPLSGPDAALRGAVRHGGRTRTCGSRSSRYSQIAAPDVVDMVWNVADATGLRPHLHPRAAGAPSPTTTSR